ncbi:MAG: hypothetical protein ACK56I_32045, partial [bacterium]
EEPDQVGAARDEQRAADRQQHEREELASHHEDRIERSHAARDRLLVAAIDQARGQRRTADAHQQDQSACEGAHARQQQARGGGAAPALGERHQRGDQRQDREERRG